MSGQLLLPMPAGPLPPLDLDGECQAARMLLLAQMADWRRSYSFEHWQYRVAKAAGYNLDIVETNYARSLRGLADAHRECAARLA